MAGIDDFENFLAGTSVSSGAPAEGFSLSNLFQRPATPSLPSIPEAPKVPVAEDRYAGLDPALRRVAEAGGDNETLQQARVLQTLLARDEPKKEESLMDRLAPIFMGFGAAIANPRNPGAGITAMYKMTGDQRDQTAQAAKDRAALTRQITTQLAAGILGRQDEASKRKRIAEILGGGASSTPASGPAATAPEPIVPSDPAFPVVAPTGIDPALPSPQQQMGLTLGGGDAAADPVVAPTAKPAAALDVAPAASPRKPTYKYDVDNIELKPLPYTEKQIAAVAAIDPQQATTLRAINESARKDNEQTIKLREMRNTRQKTSEELAAETAAKKRAELDVEMEFSTPRALREAEKTEAVEDAKVRAKAKAGLPAMEESANEMMALIDELKASKNLDEMTGYDGYLPNVSPWAQGIQAKIDQLAGGSFLSAFESLKGGGAITETEGKKATQAMNRLGNMKVTHDEYLKALDDAKRRMQSLLNIARQKAGVS